MRLDEIWIQFGLFLDAIIDTPEFWLFVAIAIGTLIGAVIGFAIGVPVGKEREAREEWKRLTVLNQQLDAERRRWWGAAQ